MKPPVTYFEWKEMMNHYATGNDTVLPFMNEGTITLDAGTVGRFMTLFEESYKKRKQLWANKLKNILQFQNVRSAADFSTVMSQAKSDLKNLVFYTDLKPFNNELKKLLKDDLKSFVVEIKKSLKQNAINDRSNQMNSLLLVFDNLDVEKISAPIPQQSLETGAPNKKRILF